MLTIVEVDRETFGGDKNAINRHSIRSYAVSDDASVTYTLDRTLDGVPPFFTLWRHREGQALSESVPVNQKTYWGDGIEWPEAEKLALAVIATLERNPS